MTSEEFLVDGIEELMEELEERIKEIAENEDVRIPLFDDGKLCGYARALGELTSLMRDYRSQGVQ